MSEMAHMVIAFIVSVSVLFILVVAMSTHTHTHTHILHVGVTPTISIIGCSDHEIQFYELVNFAPYCQLKKLEDVPLKVDFWWVMSSLCHSKAHMYRLQKRYYMYAVLQI